MEAEDNLTHTCCWCQSSMDPDQAMCVECWQENMKRREVERDHALDDLKAEIANHREDRELVMKAFATLGEGWSGDHRLTDDEHEAFCNLWQEIGDRLDLWPKETPKP